ncbi:MAG: DUF3575 domain-containing protein [Candidatus Amulumruptor caecigallinarius]|nr:DUF3575 domain-containing protein [Candidatus Amulumruptor caecigallinarius]MCM1397061.1 DUF3575 domain-containing protein [Candidatus Amulumruptor caecigallinarius]MCM1454009.1 DUF3575 domain-containing protein [bacterium]
MLKFFIVSCSIGWGFLGFDALGADSDLGRSEHTAPEETLTESAASSTGSTCGWTLSTNAVEWGMFISNISGGYNFGRSWTAALSLHYSGINYMTSRRKFRTFIVRPEMRWWPRAGYTGFFIDAHLEMAYYNFALTSRRYRIQDRDGSHPALGGGLGVGYRLRLGSGRWALEGQVGAGVYHLDYDRFYNRPNGQYVDTRRRTWFGIDNVALSIVYNFNPTTQR